MKFTIKRVSDLIAEGVLEHPMDGNHGEKHPKTSDYVKEGIPFILVPDLTNGKVALDNCNFISEEQAKTLRKGFSKTGDVLFTHKATIGKVAIVDTREYPYIILTPQITYYRLKNSDVIDSKYLYYYFTSKPFQEHFKMFASSGGTRAYLGITAQEKLNIIYPDLERQKRIADILSTYDDLIENNNRRIALLEKAAQELYKEWFVRFRFPGYKTAKFENGLPEGWERKKISAYYNTCSGGTPSRTNEEYYDSGIYPWVKTGEVKDCIIIDTEEHITEEAIKKSSAKLLPARSVAMAMYGVNIGQLGYFDGQMTCNQACCVFADKRDFSSKHYLFYYQKSIREYLLLISFGAAQQNLSQDLIKKVKIVMPSDDVVCAFEEKLDLIYDSIKLLMLKNQNLTKQRDLLLPRLMSGKLEV